MRRISMFVVSMLVLAVCVGFSSAASATTEPADTLKVTYFANANTTGAPDATLRFTNVGTSGGNLCVDIFIFDPNQEMSACCSCSVTPNGLLTLSVDTLISNPLTGKTLTSGTISIVSSKNSCGGAPEVVTPAAGIKGWATHIQNSKFTVTEEEFVDSTFSSAQLGLLQTDCTAIVNVGSGSGICPCVGE